MKSATILPDSRARHCARVITAAAACCLLAACAAPKSRLLAEEVPSTAPDTGWIAKSPDGVTFGIRQVIVRNSDGSWVRDANWDEYVVEVRNESSRRVRIDGFSLYGTSLDTVTPRPCKKQPPATCEPIARSELSTSQDSTTSREKLDMETSSTLRLAKDAGVIVGSGLVPFGVASGVFLASSSLTWGTVAVVGTAALIAAPVAATVATVHVVKKHRQEKQDLAAIDRNLVDRSLSAPAELRELWLPLPALANLHLATDPARPGNGA